jgi:hypothetical protein
MLTGEVASTAYWQARRAGWSAEELESDALYTVRRGGKAGMLVERLREQARHGPRREEARRQRKPWEAPVFVPPEPVLTPPAHVAERVQLLRAIATPPVPSPEMAEKLMRDMIERQNKVVE